MNCKSILCVAIALMITSVGCFTALGSGNSDATPDDAPVLSILESGEETVDSDCITIVLPSYDSTTGTYSSTEYTEVIFHHETLEQVNVSATDGGVTKVEPFFYYPHTTAGITEHYSGDFVYLSANTLKAVVDVGASALGYIGGIVGTVGVAAIIAALDLIGIDITTYYPNGAVFVMALSIYLTTSITIPIVGGPILLEVYSQ